VTFEEWYKTLGTAGKNQNPFGDWFVAMQEAYKKGFEEGKRESEGADVSAS
jgi:hypothetical protein